MTDKYEEFKKWFMNQTDFTWSAGGYHFVDYDDKLPFTRFEHEQKEKEKEKEIKAIIRQIISTTPIHPIENVKIGVVYCADEVVDKIYNKLKQGEYLK